MALSIQELETQLLAAKKAARTTGKTMRYKEIVAAITPAEDALTAAQAYKLTLVNDIKVIDGALKGLANETNLKFQGIVNQVNALNEQIADASEELYISLLAQIENLRDDAERLKLTDYKQNFRFDDLKRQRNEAVTALALHINVISALEAVI